MLPVQNLPTVQPLGSDKIAGKSTDTIYIVVIVGRN